ncbi:MAG: type IX secretion system outer membrane channel protein PorV, partial [Prevotella sp.]|nr:type IX secretion system outer membrane channel protein PorV [Prevotella sp.]
MRLINKRFFSLGLFAVMTLCVYSQGTEDSNPITTAVPSLTIAPEARGGGMGDIGAATLPDVYSQHWNPAKYPFTGSTAGVGLSYTPWLRKLVNDIALIYVSGFYKFGEDYNQAVSASIRYFSLGDVPITTLDGDFLRNVRPMEMAIDIGYSRKLTETFSGGVVLRYIRTDYTTGDDDTSQSPGNAYAADIAGYNESYVMVGEVESLLGLGFNISNIGSKISQDAGEYNQFIPTTLRLGASLTYPLDDYNTLAFNADVSKLLVPTPPILKDGESSEDFRKRQEEYREGSSISGIFKSFTDAPGGMNEELKEVMWSAGLEYTYNNQ